MTDLRKAAEDALRQLERLAPKNDWAAILPRRAALNEVHQSMHEEYHGTMGREDIIRLAQEAGLHHFYDSEGHCSGVTNAKIEGEENNDALVAMLAPFAALVAAAEREACIKALEDNEQFYCRDTIRARGK